MYFPLVLLHPGPTTLLYKLQSFLVVLCLVFPSSFSSNPMLLSPSPSPSAVAFASSKHLFFIPLLTKNIVRDLLTEFLVPILLTKVLMPVYRAVLPFVKDFNQKLINWTVYLINLGSGFRIIKRNLAEDACFYSAFENRLQFVFIDHQQMIFMQFFKQSFGAGSSD
jgi:hypothetical protein